MHFQPDNSSFIDVPNCFLIRAFLNDHQSRYGAYARA
jgi:hypothetical protein